MKTISCQQCGGEIPPHRLKKNSQQKFCKRACFHEWMSEWQRGEGKRPQEFWQKFSAAGNQAQKEIMAGTGVKPGHEKRSVAASKSDHEKPRRRKHPQNVER